MASVTIRNLDAEVVRSLKARASAAGRSLEEELRGVLRREAARSDDVARRRALVDWLREHGARLPAHVDVVELMREPGDIPA